MTDLAATLRTLLARRSPAVSDDDVAAAREFVRLALDQAKADAATYAARSTRAPETRRLARVNALAARAAAGDAVALAGLRDVLGDGAEIDAAVARGMGGVVAGFTDAASNFARAEHRHSHWWAQQVAAACSMAATAAPRRRRGGRFFSVLALAFVFIDLTGEAPTATPVEGCVDTGRDFRFEWRRGGLFADFVNAADVEFDFADGGSLDAAVGDALRVGRAEIALHLATPGRRWPAPFGTPLFALAASDDEGPDAA